MSTAVAGLLAGGALVTLGLLPQPALVAGSRQPSASPASALPGAENAARPSTGPLRGEVRGASAPLPTRVATAPPKAATRLDVHPSAVRTAPSARATAAPRSAVPSVFLPLGSCAARSPHGTWSQMACGASEAYAKVIERFPAGGGSTAACPADTDYALALSTVWSDGRSAVPSGTACLRTLRAPHPSDPGNGGGVGIVVGDCLYGAGGDTVRETACVGGAVRAQYRVIAITPPAGASCPRATQLLITIQNPGAGRQTACAVRL